MVFVWFFGSVQKIFDRQPTIAKNSAANQSD